MPFLLTDSPQKLKLEMTDGTLIILTDVSPSSPQQQRHCFLLIKTLEKTILQQVSCENTPIIVLKRMIGSFLKFPSLKRILEFQD